MSQRIIRSLFAIFAIVFVSAMIASAQSTTTVEIPTNNHSSWQAAQLLGSAKKSKLFVVTINKPNSRQSCRIQSFTEEMLVCSKSIGGTRTYLRQQVVALIIPGDNELRVRVLLALNGGLGAAIWGTVVLAATCPACAVGTGIAAFIFFAFAGAIEMTDDVPDRLLYLSPGKELSRKLGYVQM